MMEHTRYARLPGYTILCESEVPTTQYMSLRQRIEIFRKQAEFLFDSGDRVGALCVSQHLDMLIHYLVVLRSGTFYRGRKKWSVKRKMPPYAAG